MRKIIVVALFLLLAPPSYSAVTLAQMQQVAAALKQIIQTAHLMAVLDESSVTAFNRSNTYQLDFSTATYAMTAQQQQDIVTYYQSLKAQLQAEVASLP